MQATKIKMMPGCGNSNNLTEIDEIYITGRTQDNFYKKEEIHDYLKNNPGTIQVNISPYYPDCIPATSAKGEKYVKSAPNDTTADNLLKLPRV